MNKSNDETGSKIASKRHRRNHIIIVILATLAILTVFLVIIKVLGSTSSDNNDGTQQEVSSTKDAISEKEKDENMASVTFKATGDNLIHNTIYEQAAARSKGKGYDFTYAYADIAPLIADTDLVFVNQETPVATAIFEPENYPQFNTPSETVTALNKIGFNLFNLASNHTLDQGYKGMEATIDFMNTVPNSTNFGAYRNYTDERTPRLVEVNGIIFGFVGVTEMTNGMTLPASSELDIVYTSQSDKIKTMIEDAKAEADVVVLSVHWGDENVLTAAPRQKKMGKSFADMGADLIIGHHPHVLQEIETITASDNRKVPVVYSLGNFISAMRSKENHVGGFFGCTINKDLQDGSVSISNLSFTPVVNYFTGGYGNIHVIPFSEYTTDMAANHGLGLSIDDVDGILQQTVGADILKKSNYKKTNDSKN